MKALVLLLALQAATPDALFRQSVDLTAEADTTGALAALDQSLAGDLTSPEALLALGRLHLARGEAGPAVFALERAARLLPADPEIASARREAYALSGQVAPVVPPPFVAARTVVSRIGAGALVGLALLLYLGAAALGFAWWRSRSRQIGWGAVALAPLALLAVALAALAVWDAGSPRGVALVAVEARARPTPEAEGIGRVREGEVVPLEATASGWRQVRLGDATGWVPARSTAEL